MNRVLVLCILLTSSVAHAETLWGECVGDSVRLVIGVPHAYDAPEVNYAYVIERTLVGSCLPPETVTTAPIPYPETSPGFTYVETIVPGPTIAGVARYELFRAHDDGTFTPAGYSGDTPWFDLLSCGYEGPIATGRIVFADDTRTTGRFIPCDTSCQLDEGYCFQGLGDSWIAYAMTQLTVELFGSVTASFYPSTAEVCAGGSSPYFVNVTEVRAVDDCGIVASEPRTWGGVKAKVR